MTIFLISSFKLLSFQFYIFVLMNRFSMMHFSDRFITTFECVLDLYIDLWQVVDVGNGDETEIGVV